MTKRVMKRRAKKAGLPPGSLVYLGDKPSTDTKITLFDYVEGQFVEREITKPDECAACMLSSMLDVYISIMSNRTSGVIESDGAVLRDLYPADRYHRHFRYELQEFS